MKKYKRLFVTVPITVILLVFIVILGLHKYKESPRYLIKHTIMRYEQDFNLPFFATRIRFDYDWETGNYIGKFMIGETSAQRLKAKLEAAQQRYSEASSILRSMAANGSNAWASNTTSVVNRLDYNTECDRIFPEEWMGEEDADILCYYVTSSYYYEGLTEEYTKPGEDVFDNYIVIFKNKNGRYFLCIKRTDYSDWDGIVTR